MVMVVLIAIIKKHVGIFVIEASAKIKSRYKLFRTLDTLTIVRRLFR